MSGLGQRQMSAPTRARSHPSVAKNQSAEADFVNFVAAISSLPSNALPGNFAPNLTYARVKLNDFK
jgi:hypothetical protein